MCVKTTCVVGQDLMLSIQAPGTRQNDYIYLKIKLFVLVLIQKLSMI